MKILYIFWLLLPVGLISMGIWAVVKPYLGVRGSEAAKPYLVQGLYCLFAFGLAVLIDQTTWFEETINAYSFSWFNISIARWLLYPGVLVGLAYIQKYWRKEDKNRVAPRRFIYN